VDNEFKEVVMLETETSICSATIVGPQVLLTAGHCGETGDTMWFKLKGDRIEGTFLKSSDSALDLGVVILDETIDETQVNRFAIVSGSSISLGQKIWALGYGCTGPDESGVGTLRKGLTSISSFEGLSLVFSGQPALCFGDSGSGVFLFGQNRDFLVGVNSKGNVRDRSLSVRMDSLESKNFLNEVVLTKNVEICGVSATCGPQPTLGNCI